jgi:hypothetical protein
MEQITNMLFHYYDSADQKMRKQDSMIGVRLSSEKKTEMQRLISEGKFKNLSQVCREALKQFLGQS